MEYLRTQPASRNPSRRWSVDYTPLLQFSLTPSALAHRHTPHAQVLKLLARNAEANRHLFAVGRSPTPAEATETGADSSSGDGACVVAVRELDWFTFSREEGSTVVTKCDPAEEVSEVDQERSRSGERRNPAMCVGELEESHTIGREVVSTTLLCSETAAFLSGSTLSQGGGKQPADWWTLTS